MKNVHGISFRDRCINVFSFNLRFRMNDILLKKKKRKHFMKNLSICLCHKYLLYIFCCCVIILNPFFIGKYQLGIITKYVYSIRLFVGKWKLINGIRNEIQTYFNKLFSSIFLFCSVLVSNCVFFFCVICLTFVVCLFKYI